MNDTIALLIPYIMMLVSYLIGSIPMGLWMGKITKGVDIRDYGSGNLGTTNAMRVMGKKLGMVVFLLDVLKGGFVIFLIRLGLFDAFDMLHPLLYGLLASVGHIFSIFVKFKGGKAVATSAGIFLFYAPVLGLLGLLGYVAGVKFTRYISVGSTAGAIVVFIAVIIVYFFGPSEGSSYEWMFGMRRDWFLPAVTVVGISLIFYRHIGNFKRILNKTEPKSNFLQKHKIEQTIKKR